MEKILSKKLVFNGLSDPRTGSLTIRISPRSREILNNAYTHFGYVGESISSFIIRAITEYAEERKPNTGVGATNDIAAIERAFQLLKQSIVRVAADIPIDQIPEGDAELPIEIPVDVRKNLEGKILRALKRHGDSEGWVSRTRVLDAVSFKHTVAEVNAAIQNLISTGAVAIGMQKIDGSQKNSVVYRIAVPVPEAAAAPTAADSAADSVPTAGDPAGHTKKSAKKRAKKG